MHAQGKGHKPAVKTDRMAGKSMAPTMVMGTQRGCGISSPNPCRGDHDDGSMTKIRDLKRKMDKTALAPGCQPVPTPSTTTPEWYGVVHNGSEIHD